MSKRARPAVCVRVVDCGAWFLLRVPDKALPAEADKMLRSYIRDLPWEDKTFSQGMGAWVVRASWLEPVRALIEEQIGNPLVVESRKTATWE